MQDSWAYKSLKFLEIGQGVHLCEGTLYQKVEIFILGAAFPPSSLIEVKFCTVKRTQVPVGPDKFDLNRCNESPLRGEKPDFWPMSKFNIGSLPLCGILPVKNQNGWMASSTSCVGGRHNMSPPPASWPLTFWPWKWCPSHVGYLCAILVFLDLSVLDLGPMYVIDRQTSDAHHHLMNPTLGAGT